MDRSDREAEEVHSLTSQKRSGDSLGVETSAVKRFKHGLVQRLNRDKLQGPDIDPDLVAALSDMMRRKPGDGTEKELYSDILQPETGQVSQRYPVMRKCGHCDC